MRIPGHVPALILAGLSLQAVQAQTPAPPSSPDAPPAQITSLSPAATPPSTNSAAVTLDYLFNHQPQEGTAAQAASGASGDFADKVKALDALNPPGLDDPIIREQFETYLSLPEVPENRIKQYLDKVEQISEMLRNSDTPTAWTALYGLNEYQDLDAGLSMELANRVESIRDAVHTVEDLTQTNDRLRQEIKTSDWNADVIAQKQHEQEVKDNWKKATGNGNNDSQEVSVSATNGVSGLLGKAELTNEYAKTLEDRAKIALNEHLADTLMEQAKSDFAGYITTLFNGHRYYHVVLAANFYRNLFNETDYTGAMTTQVNTSLKIDHEVHSNLEAFQRHAGNGEIAGATNCLVQAFIGNPFDPALHGLSRSEKERVSRYMHDLERLRNALEVRDFGKVVDLVTGLQQLAVDFDSTKPLEWVGSAKLANKLHLGKARLLAQQGKLSEAMAQFEAAAAIWPGDPDLQEMAVSFFHSQDLKYQAVNDFDRLVTEKNYHAISDQQVAFAPAIKGDATREAQMNIALNRVRKAETALDKANHLAMRGDIFGAWEATDVAVKDWPDDQKLNKLLANLSVRGATFVTAIASARDAEAHEEPGLSITWYVNAQSLYPSSQIAADGIDRLSKRILAAGIPKAAK